MESTSLYYFFSTVAQVLAAISALLAIFTQFKTGELVTFLVGDGAATYERMRTRQQGYFLHEKGEHDKYSDRLRDAIGRKSILGIFEVIIKPAAQEKNEGKTLQSNPRGLQYLMNRVEARISQISKLKGLTKKSIIKLI